jgi:hypothetical protein
MHLARIVKGQANLDNVVQSTSYSKLIGEKHARASGWKPRLWRSRKPECPTAVLSDRTPIPCPDSSGSSPTGQARQSPQRRTAPDVAPEASHPPTAAEGSQSRGQSCGNCSKACHPVRKKGRINAKILPNAKSDRLLADISIALYRALIGARGIPSERRGGMALHCVRPDQRILARQSHAHRSRAIVVLRLASYPASRSTHPASSPAPPEALPRAGLGRRADGKPVSMSLKFDLYLRSSIAR